MEKIQKFEEHKSINESNWFQKNWNKAVLKMKGVDNDWKEFIKKLSEDNQMPFGVSVMFAGDTTVYGKQFSKKSNKDRKDRKETNWDNHKLLNHIHRPIKENYGEEENIPVTLESPNPNMLNGDLIDVKNSIISRFNMRINEGDLDALFIWGAPGIGKTEAISRAANELGLDLIVFHLSQIEPTDFKGVPYVIDQEIRDLSYDPMKDGQRQTKEIRKRSSFALPLIFPTKDDKGRNPRGGILFFDELNQADEMVLSAALPLMLDGGYNGYDLPDDWIVIAAGNRQMETDVTTLGAPLSGRFAHINLVPTVAEWTKFAYENIKVDSRLVEFFKNSPDMFFDLIPTRGDNNGPYASPRNWTKASYINYSDSKGKFNYYGEDTPYEESFWREFKLRVGHVGANAYKVFLKVISQVSQKEIDEVYSKGLEPKSFKSLNMIENPGLLQNIIGVIASEKAGKDNNAMTLDEFKNYIKYAETFENHEQVTLALKSLSDAAGGGKKAWFRDDIKNKKYFDIWLPLAQKWHMEGVRRKSKGNY